MPSIREIFGLAELSKIQWAFVGIISVLPIVIMEMQKKLNEILFGKPVYGYKEVRQ